ncbi:Uncharacterized protein F383_12778 [Gossypium arboreum]|uniref:Uncharacterized protein n=1 Tax=Gossypium arboreum TaxID=29729 RepID=A0A0B0PRM3_GOSAR|nr:Uncharacterized protein F383_12778 [Gossypium arboreum]
MEDDQISGDDIDMKDLNPRQLQLFVKLLNATDSRPSTQGRFGDFPLQRYPQPFPPAPRWQRRFRVSAAWRSHKGRAEKDKQFRGVRDMSGRRLRHVNAEKRLEEWKAEEEQRKLEKIAEDFIKKKAKTGKKGVGDGEAEKYVEKYREQSARCVAVVEESVRAACQNGKRKTVPGGADPKRLKIWMGKRKVDESDSDSDYSSEDEDNEENEKSVVLNNGNHSDSSKGAEGSSGSVLGGKQDIDFSIGVSSGTGSEEEKEVVLHRSSESCEDVDAMVEADVIAGSEAAHPEMPEQNGTKTQNQEEIVSQCLSADPVAENGVGSELIDGLNCSSIPKPEVHKDTLVSNVNATEPENPLNFDDFNSSAEMEVLGLERLKSELQSRGLKCGGTLQERAARLFLLKSTPLDKLPRKLLAKK